MENYNAKKISLGGSDIAAFTMTGFDDERLVYSVRADKIEVYRTGEYGILIRVCNEDPIRILRRETVIYDHR